jgi:guanosine-3',5'-bis(diphosphate) 3'-pyrophosphohydrolase
MDALIARALTFAAYKHRHQDRKSADRIPYINHPLELVEVLVVEAGITDTDVICAAILHDTVEDTDTAFYEIEEIFGPVITGIVREVTDDKTLPKTQRKQAQIDHAPHASLQAKLVKLADKVVNLRDIAYRPPVGWSLQRISEYADCSEQVAHGLRGAHEKLEHVFNTTLAQTRQEISKK